MCSFDLTGCWRHLTDWRVSWILVLLYKGLMWCVRLFRVDELLAPFRWLICVARLDFVLYGFSFVLFFYKLAVMAPCFAWLTVQLMRVELRVGVLGHLLTVNAHWSAAFVAKFLGFLYSRLFDADGVQCCAASVWGRWEVRWFTVLFRHAKFTYL